MTWGVSENWRNGNVRGNDNRELNRRWGNTAWEEMRDLRVKRAGRSIREIRRGGGKEVGERWPWGWKGDDRRILKGRG